jgi:hypothetical protein
MRCTGPGVSGDRFVWRDRRPRTGRVARKESQPSEQWQGSLLFSSVREPRLGKSRTDLRKRESSTVQVYRPGNGRRWAGMDLTRRMAE